jgi:AcrR family transcriptional regulator
MLAALADVVAERGYAALTVEQVIARAGVSRRTFYDQFPGKQEAFFAAYDASVQQAMLAAATAFASSEDWPVQVRRGLRALLQFMAGDEPFTRMGVLEMPLAGPEGHARHLAARAGFELFLAPGAELADHTVPPLVAKTVGSGIFELIQGQVVAGRTQTLVGSLLPASVYHALAPYLGVRRAAREARLAGNGRLPN